MDHELNERSERGPALSPQQRLFAQTASPFETYRELAAANCSLPEFLWYELVTTLFSGLPGLVGFASRALIYPSLFRSSGKRPAFGRGVLVRSPKNIVLGRKVMIDDYAVLDSRRDSLLQLGDFVSIGRSTSIICKGESIVLHEGVNVGFSCRIATQSKVEIGASTLIAGFCYIGPGNHSVPEDGGSIMESGMDLKGGVKIGQDVWLGTRVTVLDGVTIGDSAIVGAHSLVRESVPAGAIVAGTPAKVLGYRKGFQSEVA